MTMIKIQKAVMQEVEVSKEEIIRDLIGVKGAKFDPLDLVYVNCEDGYQKAENSLGVITHVTSFPYHPVTGAHWEKEVDKKDRVGYTVTYKGCNGCKTVGNFAADSLTAI